MNSNDAHWEEVMKLASKYGFIVSAYGGVAVLATHENQIKYYGQKKYEKIQLANKEE